MNLRSSPKYEIPNSVRNSEFTIFELLRVMLQMFRPHPLQESERSEQRTVTIVMEHVVQNVEEDQSGEKHDRVVFIQNRPY